MWRAGFRGGVAFSNAVAGFFQAVDEFDFDEFFRQRSIGRVKIPSLPLQLPSTKTFEGIGGMEKCVASFLKATALSSSKRDVSMYTNHPLNHCYDDPEFVNQLIKGIGALLLKGLHVNIVHNIDRPLQELMLGLEALIPMHMTGQVSSYYFPERQSSFYHLLLVSGAASAAGEAVSGFPDGGRYTFSKVNAEVSYNRAQMDQLLSRARPLVQMFQKNKPEAFDEFLRGEFLSANRYKIYSSAPFVALMSEDLLDRILAHNDVPEKEKEIIRAGRPKVLDWLCNHLENNVIEDRVAVWSQSDFNKYPASLSLGFIFGSGDVQYSYQEYLEHLEAIKEFAKQHKNYHLILDEAPLYRNIQIYIGDTNFALVSRNKAPAVHFLLQHPRIVAAVEKFAGKEDE